MPVRSLEPRPRRRDLLASAAGMAGLAAFGSLLNPSSAKGATAHKPLDPVNPDILYGTTSSLWRPYKDLEWGIKRVAYHGLQGIEPYADAIQPYRKEPLKLKKIFDDHGITMIDVSNGERGQSTNFIDKDQIPKTIADHVTFAREFLVPFGCTHYKANMGQRPPGGPSDDQLKRLADTLNEIGRQTIEMGIRIAPHPHTWGPM